MNPSFIEELFFKIDEKLSSMEKEMSEIRADLAVISDEVLRCRECRSEMENMKRWFWVGRGIVMIIWGFTVTVVNLLIGKMIK